MAATNSGYPVDAWMANVIRSRWVAVAGAALVGLLAATGSIPPGVGIVILILLVLLAALGAVLPRDNADRRPAGPQSLPLAAASLEPELGLVAEALPDPCFILDRRGVVRHANRWAMASFAIHPGDTLTARLRVPALVAAFDRVARGGPPERVEFVERVPTERWFAAWFAHLAEPGELILLVLDDMSERRRSERVRADFVANASHELRTPLASLAGFIETLQGPAREDPEARDRFLSIMHEQAERMRRLIDDLLSLSRVEMKAHVRPAEPVDVSAAIRHVADSLAPLARELDVTIETRLPAEPAVVAGDRDELIQVFENLIENACKYGQSGRRVIVTAVPGGADSGPTVSVRDFGPGIPEEHLPRLTERFYRVDVDESRRHRGTGLGLAIVKHILARHQARMRIDSRLGQGAEFSVTFPQAILSSVEKDNIKQILIVS